MIRGTDDFDIEFFCGGEKIGVAVTGSRQQQ